MSNDNIKKSLVEEIFDKARRGNKEALRELESLAENEDADALSKLAEIYLKGLGGVEQLPKKALEFLHRAAAQNYVPALYRLGDFYYYGKGGLNVDARKAVEYLTKAAALGEWKIYKLLGEIYLNCEGGIEADGYKAIEYLLKYAEATQRQMTDAEDIYTKEKINEIFKTVADLYLCGKCGVTQDSFKAIEFYKKCGEHCKDDVERLTQANENPQEMMNFVDEEDEPDYEFLANSYRYGINGVKQNGQKVLEYLIRDFEENINFESLYEIRQIYLYGCGELKPDWHKALKFANVYFGEPLMIYDDMLALKFVCVFDDKLGYCRKDGLLTLAELEDRYNYLKNLKVPIIGVNELRRVAEIHEEGYGGLEPNRKKSIKFYSSVSRLRPEIRHSKASWLI